VSTFVSLAFASILIAAAPEGADGQDSREASPSEAAPSNPKESPPVGDLRDLEDASRTTKTRLAVMSLSAAGVPEEYAVGLTESIATHAAQTGVFDTISPKQISSLLAYEKRKELLGACTQEDCYVQIAQTVKADHLLAGNVAKVGDKLVLNLVLIDAAQGKALKRTSRETTSASELMTEAGKASTIVLQPVLTSRRGFLKVAANVGDAQVIVDDERRSEGVGQVIPLAAGPHVLKISKDGFYATTADVFVRPSRVTEEVVKLIPAKDTIESYETKASMMRYGGYAAGAVAIAGAVAAGFFYTKATDDKAFVDRYSSALDAQRASGAVGSYAEAQSAQDSFNSNQTLYLVGLGSAVVAGAASLYLLIAGDDPDRYEEFHSLSQ
jgi:TolB-like protein